MKRFLAIGVVAVAAVVIILELHFTHPQSLRVPYRDAAFVEGGTAPAVGDVPPPPPTQTRERAHKVTATSDVAATPATPRAYRLRGRLLGITGPLSEPPSLVVLGIPREDCGAVPSLTTSDAGTEFDVDVSPLFARGLDLESLDVTVRQPDYLLGHANVDLPEGVGEGAEWSVDVTLKPAAIVTVRVVDPNGAPLPTAIVKIQRLVDGLPRGDGAVGGFSEARGCFVIRGAEDGPHFLSVTLLGRKPASEVVDVRMYAPTSAPDLVIGSGFAISGTARAASGAPLSGASIRCILDSDRDALPVDPGSALVDGRLAATGASATTDENGGFELTGLDTEDYRVWVDGVPNDGVRETPDDGRLVSAPASNVDLVLSATSRIVVDVLGPDGPLDDAIVRFSRGRRSPVVVRRGSRAEFDALAGASYRVVVDGPRFEPQSVDFDAPAAGRHITLTLEPKGPRVAVSIHIVAPNGDLVSGARVAFIPVGSTVPEWRQVGLLNWGPYDVGEVKPGRYRLLVWLNDETEGREGLCVPTVDDLEAQANEKERTLTLRAEVGGRLRGSARNRQGRSVSATWRVVDPSGIVVDGLPGLGSPDRRVVDDSAPATTRTLPAGTYTVEVSASGYASRSIPVHIVAGETTSLDVTLEGE